MTDEVFSVFLVDDDAAVLKALARLIHAHGYQAHTFASAQDFLDQHDAKIPSCVILDVSMPRLDGLALQHALSADGDQRPIIFVTGKADIPTSVRAMKAGAIDFLTKPVDATALLAAIAHARDVDGRARQARTEIAEIRAKVATLTPREREVFTHVVVGRLNKQIASELGTVERTIKAHRSRVTEKLGVRSVADLVRLAEKAGIAAPPKTPLK